MAVESCSSNWIPKINESNRIPIIRLPNWIIKLSNHSQKTPKSRFKSQSRLGFAHHCILMLTIGYLSVCVTGTLCASLHEVKTKAISLNSRILLVSQCPVALPKPLTGGPDGDHLQPSLCFSSAGWVVCVCVSMLATNHNHWTQTCNLACTDLLITLIACQKFISLTYFVGQNWPPQKVGVNRHFQASWASQPVGCWFCFWWGHHLSWGRNPLTNPALNIYLHQGGNVVADVWFFVC